MSVLLSVTNLGLIINLFVNIVPCVQLVKTFFIVPVLIILNLLYLTTLTE